MFSKNGGNLGASGAVSHGFERIGLIEYPAGAGDAERCSRRRSRRAPTTSNSDEDGHRVWTAIDELHEVARALRRPAARPRASSSPGGRNIAVEVGESRRASTLLKLVDALDDDDDVQTVWGNYEVSDEVLEKLG